MERPRDPELDELMPLAATLGIEWLASTPGEVRARLAWSAGLCTAGGVLHGGALMALADSTGALCAYNNISANNVSGATASTTTVESKTNFLRGVREGYVEATSRPLHVGRTIIVVDTDLTDATGRLVARVTQSQLVIQGG